MHENIYRLVHTLNPQHFLWGFADSKGQNRQQKNTTLSAISSARVLEHLYIELHEISSPHVKGPHTPCQKNKHAVVQPLYLANVQRVRRLKIVWQLPTKNT